MTAECEHRETKLNGWCECGESPNGVIAALRAELERVAEEREVDRNGWREYEREWRERLMTVNATYETERARAERAERALRANDDYLVRVMEQTECGGLSNDALWMRASRLREMNRETLGGQP